MTIARAIEALCAELRAIHGTEDDAITIGAALGGLAVLAVIARGNAHTEADALDTISASYPQPPALDTRRMGQDVLRHLAEVETATAAAPATQTPQPPSARPLPVASPASDADPPSSAEAPPTDGRKALRTWPPARDAALRQHYPAGDHVETLRVINGIPARLPVTSIDAMKRRAHELGVTVNEDAIRSGYAKRMAALPKANRGRPKQGTPRLWTPPLVDLLRAEYPRGDLAALLAQINAQAPKPISAKALEQAAYHHGVKRAPELRTQQRAASLAKARRWHADQRAQREASAPPAAHDHVPDATKMVDPEPPPPAPSKPTLRDRVAAAMARGVKDWVIWSSQQGVSLHEVYRHTYSIQREQKEQAA